MSTNPAKSRNFRRRGHDDDTDASANANATSTHSTAPTNTRNPPSSSKPKKLLSFADDEEEGMVTPSSKSKSKPQKQKPLSSSSRLSNPNNSSHKLTASKDRLSPTLSASTTSNVQPQAGIYTKEALLELQKNTRTLAYKPSSSSSASDPPKIILKGLLKPTHDDFDHEDDPIISQPLQDQQDSDAEKRFASLGLGKSSTSSDYSSFIPDEDTIKKIRAKRERLRQSRAAAPDYISLDAGGGGLGTNHDVAEAFSDEEPEFRTRIAMIGKRDTTNHGVFEDVDVATALPADHHLLVKSNVLTKDTNIVVTAADEEEDEEDKMWEEEQFRKGLGKRMDDGPVLTSNSTGTATMHNQHQQQQQQQPPPPMIPSIGGAFGASQALDALSIPQQAEIAKKALQDNLRRLKVSDFPFCNLLSC